MDDLGENECSPVKEGNKAAGINAFRDEAVVDCMTPEEIMKGHLRASHYPR